MVYFPPVSPTKALSSPPPYFQQICSDPRLSTPFRNILSSYGEELLLFRPTRKLEGYPCRLSATAYSIYSHLSSIHSLRMRHAVVRRTHLLWSINRYSSNLIKYHFIKKCVDLLELSFSPDVILPALHKDLQALLREPRAHLPKHLSDRTTF